MLDSTGSSVCSPKFAMRSSWCFSIKYANLHDWLCKHRAHGKGLSKSPRISCPGCPQRLPREERLVPVTEYLIAPKQVVSTPKKSIHSYHSREIIQTTYHMIVQPCWPDPVSIIKHFPTRYSKFLLFAGLTGSTTRTSRIGKALNLILFDWFDFNNRLHGYALKVEYDLNITVTERWSVTVALNILQGELKVQCSYLAIVSVSRTCRLQMGIMTPRAAGTW